MQRLLDLLPADGLQPELRAVLADGSGGEVPQLLREVGEGVWSLDLLTTTGCEALLGEVDRRAAALPSSAAPNSMHAYGSTLADLGLGELARALREELVAPVGARHFASLGGSRLTAEHGFLAEYCSGADEELGYHVDDSVVTLNLCLGEEFSGTELYFRGVRCDAHRQTPWTPSEAFELDHEPGRAILHAGRHRHGVHPIRRGRRRNLILWCQDPGASRRMATCGPWCGNEG